jgi:D-alanyl-D-alanine carboxypeptidase/D-alanyl-D-alanine-endopeptidase (penicillin-binding protein 4)
LLLGAYRRQEGWPLPVKQVLVAAVAATALVAALAGCGRPIPTTPAGSSPPTQSAPRSSGSAAASATPSATPTPSARTPSPVLVPAPTGAPPNAAEVTARVKGTRVKDALGGYSAAVVDVGSGATLFRHQADRARIPASTMKLVTGAAVLAALGPDHTFRTTVVQAKAGEIVLVGGGDPYLTAKSAAGTFPRRASVNDLAKSTAAALARSRTRTVRLGYDARLFTGPAWNPAWPRGYGDQVTPISALWVDEGRLYGSTGPRTKNPARAAAEAFGAALRKRGVRVTGLAPTRAPQGATELAAVASPALERVVEQMLLVSDNDAAEVLLRHVALAAGRPGSTAEGVRAVGAQLTELGVGTEGARIVDGSGLARQNALPATTLVRLLRLAAAETRPELRALVTGLPVAGVEGSLRIRFGDDASLAGRGVVRGKTGTLREVHSLAGLIRTRDGSVLVFAFLINRPKNAFNARVWLDRATAAISTCGCR